jgi:uncharacterized Fe-S cluster protein YjdI
MHVCIHKRNFVSLNIGLFRNNEDLENHPPNADVSEGTIMGWKVPATQPSGALHGTYLATIGEV